MTKTEIDCSDGATKSNFTTSLVSSRTSILLTGIPMPPSSNNQYMLIKKRGKTIHVASNELKIFKSHMSNYRFSLPNLNNLKNKAILWRNNKVPLEIRAIFFFHNKRLFTKLGYPKKMDVSNRLKALHDSVSEMLGIDDCIFFRVYAEKTECHQNLNEMACVEIVPIV